jgi:hypothetical protein
LRAVTNSLYVHPSGSDTQRVRWYLADTAVGEDGVTVVDPLVTDLEIEFALGEKGGDAKAAAAFCFRYAATKLLREPSSVRLLDFSMETGSSARDIAEAYLRLAERLEREVARPNLYAGGISVSDKETVEQNTDRVAPFFKRGMHDYPGA